jgi:hypothetical protein
MQRKPNRRTILALKEEEPGGGEVIDSLDTLLADSVGWHAEVDTGKPVGNEFSADSAGLAEGVEARTNGYVRKWLDDPAVRALVHRNIKPEK